jgi:hypothetical protein
MNHVDAGRSAHQRNAHVRRAAHAGAAKVELAGISLGVGDEFGD